MAIIWPSLESFAYLGYVHNILTLLIPASHEQHPRVHRGYGSHLGPIFNFWDVYPRLLRDHRNARVCYGCAQVVLSLAVVCFRGSIASSVHGSRSTFEFFHRDPARSVICA